MSHFSPADLQVSDDIPDYVWIIEIPNPPNGGICTTMFTKEIYAHRYMKKHLVCRGGYNLYRVPVKLSAETWSSFYVANECEELYDDLLEEHNKYRVRLLKAKMDAAERSAIFINAPAQNEAAAVKMQILDDELAKCEAEKVTLAKIKHDVVPSTQ